MVKAILKLLAKSKPVNDKIKVYRGEYLPGKNPSEGFKQKGEYFDNIKEKLEDIDLTPEKYANKLNKSEGRYFSTKKDIAKIFIPFLVARLIAKRSLYVTGGRLIF